MSSRIYCQKCRTPLKAESSLDDLNPAAFDLLVGSANKKEQTSASQSLSEISHTQERQDRYARATRQPQSPVHKRSIPPPKDGNPAMSFIEITESQIVSPEAAGEYASADKLPPNLNIGSEGDLPLSTQVIRHERLFSILSAHSDIDHPVCVECSSMLLAGQTIKLANATKERDAYASFLKQLQQAAIKHKDDEASVKKELAALQKEEQEAFSELLQLEDQRQRLEDELADLEDEERQLELEEQRFWHSRNTFDEQEHTLQVDLASLHQKLAHDQKQLEKLQRTNVYNDTFFISHDGNFGTINGLRLGRLSNIKVEWSEINAAWGQTLLLLQTLAERLSFTFQGYRLRPLGNTSRIEKIEYPQQHTDTAHDAAARSNSNASATITALDLYSSGAAFNRVFQSRKFDSAMVAFLDCLSQLGKHVEKSSTRDASKSPLFSGSPNSNPVVPSLRLPYVIEGDMIWNRDRPEEAYSIKLGVGFALDENFTKACKYVLTCCKYLLAHVSNLDNSRSV